MLCIALTPNHVLLASVIAQVRAPRKAHLVVIHEFELAEQYAALTRIWPDAPFAHVEILPGIFTQTSLANRRRQVRANSIALRRLVSRLQPQELYVFHDGRPDIQAALFQAKRSAAQVCCTYVEDGLGAYDSSVTPAHSLPARVLAKLYYGYWWQDIGVRGCSSWIDRAMGIFPEVFRPELHHLPAQAISADALHTALTSGLLDFYRHVHALQPAQVTDLNGLLILPHSGWMDQFREYHAILHTVLQAFQHAGLRIGVKYHPREEQDDYLQLAAIPYLTILPKEVPAEIIYALAAAQLRVVVGDLSASILTARWMLPTVGSICLGPMLHYADAQLYASFTRMGIHVIATQEQLAQAIATCIR